MCASGEGTEGTYDDLGFPGMPEGGWPENPYDEDGYCEFCGNGSWKLHAPWCLWQDAKDARSGV